MINLKNMNKCKGCGRPYPNRFDKCPSCHDAKSAPRGPLTQEQVEKAVAVALDQNEIDETQIK